MGLEHSSEAQRKRARSRWGPPEPRFWAKTTKASNGCLEWTGALYRNGYGAARHPDTQRQTTAHRVAWRYAHGEDPPDGVCVCHKCDNRSCVNPEHLFLGTQKDNMADMIKKGRQATGEDLNHPEQKGEQNFNSKLTEDVVYEVKRLHHEKVSQREIARRLQIHHANVWCIVNKKSWAHVSYP